MSASISTDNIGEPAQKRQRVAGDGVSSLAQTLPQSQPISDSHEPSRLLGLPTPIHPPAVPGIQPVRDSDPEARSRQSTVSGGDEVAEVYTETRMLQDPTGRLC